MFIRKVAALAAVAIVGVLALGAVSASATTGLRTDPGNSLLTGSTTITSTSSDPAILNTNLGVISCARTVLDVDVSRNLSASSITGSLTALTFTSCTDTFPVVNYTDCTLHAGSPLPSVHITANATGGHVTINNMVERCSIAGSGSVACYFSNTGNPATGIASNATSSITYTNVFWSSVSPTSDALGSGQCGAATTFSFTLTHIVQGGTNRTLTIATG